MGYNINAAVLNLGWDDGMHKGMLVRIRSIPAGKFVKVIAGSGALADGQRDAKKMSADQVKITSDLITSMFEIMGKALIEWNLNDDGVPVPCVLAQCKETKKPVGKKDRCSVHKDEEEECDIEGLLALDIDLVLEIVGEWIQKIGGISDPLSKGSSGGGTFQEGSIPMEPPSASPSS